MLIDWFTNQSNVDSYGNIVTVLPSRISCDLHDLFMMRGCLCESTLKRERERVQSLNESEEGERKTRIGGNFGASVKEVGKWWGCLIKRRRTDTDLQHPPIHFPSLSSMIEGKCKWVLTQEDFSDCRLPRPASASCWWCFLSCKPSAAPNPSAWHCGSAGSSARYRLSFPLLTSWISYYCCSFSLSLDSTCI